MSHKRTITVGLDGGHFNVRTVVKGKQLGARAAVDHAIKTKTLGRKFKTQSAAVKAAKDDSRADGKVREKMRRSPPKRK